MKKIWSVFILLVFIHTTAFSQRLSGSELIESFSLEDYKARTSNYPYPVVKDTVWMSQVVDSTGSARSSAGTLRTSTLVLSLTKDMIVEETIPYKVSLVAKVYFRKSNNIGRVDSIISTLDITYSPGRGTNYKAKDFHKLDSVVWAAVRLDTVNIVNLDNNLPLDTSFIKDHTFNFNFRIVNEFDYKPDNSTPTLQIDLNKNKGSLTLLWNKIKWAKSYDLEWQFADGYDVSSPDFRQNSTRLNVLEGKSEYVVPMISANATFRARVRPVGVRDDGSTFNGKWSSEVNSKLNPEQIFEKDKKPWQYNATYAEDGLRKDVVTIADGSGRQRQAQTKINTSNHLLIADTYYDHQGRPVAQSLPAPFYDQSSSFTSPSTPSTSSSSSSKKPSIGGISDRFLPGGIDLSPKPAGNNKKNDVDRVRDPNIAANIRPDGAIDYNLVIENARRFGYGFDYWSLLFKPSPALQYQSGFNQTEAGAVFDRRAFDLDAHVSDCDSTRFSDRMANTSGAGRYYSPNSQANAPEEVLADYTPDAEGYPYHQLEYTPDNTGRIMRQSMLGNDFKLGSGHEIKYYYSVPSQRELFRIFGHDAGDASHYSKIVIDDSNGQLQVSYKNSKGQVIANALAGTHTNPNIEGLNYTDEPPLLDQIDVMAQSNHFIDFNGSSLATQSFFVEDAGTSVALKYTLDPSAFNTILCGRNVCYDCPKILDIKVTSACGEVLYRDSSLIGNLTDTNIASCESIGRTKKDTTLTLGKGEYFVYKSLSIVESAKQQYISDYIQKDTACFNPIIAKPTCAETPSCVPCQYEFRFNAVTRKSGNDPNCQRICKDQYADFDISLFNSMCMDVSPLGIYGEMDRAKVDTFKLSLFNTANLWGVNYTNPGLVYLDATGNRDLVNITEVDRTFYNSDSIIADRFVRPNNIVNINYLQRIWKQSWSEALVIYHPEYVYLIWNNVHGTSFKRDQIVKDTISWEGAISQGFINTSEIIDAAYLSRDPYFNGYRDDITPMLNRLNNAVTISGRSFNVYDMAKITMVCNAPIYETNSDSMSRCVERVASIRIATQSTEAKNYAWQFIKNQYQTFKNKILDTRREADIDRLTSVAGSPLRKYPCIGKKRNNDCGLCRASSELDTLLIVLTPQVIHTRCIDENNIPAPGGSGVKSYDQIAIEQQYMTLVTCKTTKRVQDLTLLINFLINHSSGNKFTDTRKTNINSVPPLVMPKSLSTNFPNQLSVAYFWKTSIISSDVLKVEILDNTDRVQASFELQKPRTRVSWNDILYFSCTRMLKVERAMSTGPDLLFTALSRDTSIMITLLNAVNLDFSKASYDAERSQIEGLLRRSNFGSPTNIKQLPNYSNMGCTQCIPRFSPRIILPPPCETDIQIIHQNEILAAKIDRARYLRDSLSLAYNRSCIIPTLEAFTITKSSSIYHYTLFYYDQAGRLMKTVPPRGVKIMIDFANINNRSTYTVPPHTDALATKYTYNSLGSKLTRATPDGGITRWVYDELGRPVMSQDAATQITKTHSYVIYDKLGRNTEAGFIEGGLDGASTALLDGKLTYKKVEAEILRAQNSKREIILSIYDKTSLREVQSQFKQRSQQNLRGRIASVLYFSNGTDQRTNNYQHAYHFSYNIAGHMTELLNDFKGMQTASGLTTTLANVNRYKKLNYKFDHISGKVTELEYQPGAQEQMYHWYEYDADNRMTSVYTGRSRFEPRELIDKDVRYEFYTHGPLARAEFGQELIQGLDLTYTINGWLKGINRAGAADPGNDGSNGLGFLADVLKQELKYFNNDFKPIRSVSAGDDAGFSQLYNGNISATKVKNLGFGTEDNHLHKYRYDQISRLTSSQRDNDQAYAMGIAYDKNGNINTLTRKDGQGNTFDNLRYRYNPSDNRLLHIKDDPATLPRSLGNDITDQPDNNYRYDSKGRLKEDAAEGQNLEWQYNDKLKTVRTTADNNTSMYYDALGRRIYKSTTATNSGEMTVRDFSGNVIAEYSIGGGSIKLDNMPIYASTRIGVLQLDTTLISTYNPNRWSQYRGAKVYELKNQIGDVNALVSDRKVFEGGNYSADIRKATDYYPFGMIMPGRDSSVTDYRYGFQGMEQDDNLKGKGNSISTEFRQYDPRVGRWLSVDPKEEKYPGWSNFVAFDDNPIGLVDPKGTQSIPPSPTGSPSIPAEREANARAVLAGNPNLQGLQTLANYFNVIIQVGLNAEGNALTSHGAGGGIYFGPNGEIGLYGTVALGVALDVSIGGNLSVTVTTRGYNDDGSSRDPQVDDLIGMGFDVGGEAEAGFCAEVALGGSDEYDSQGRPVGFTVSIGGGADPTTVPAPLQGNVSAHITESGITPLVGPTFSIFELREMLNHLPPPLETRTQYLKNRDRESPIFKPRFTREDYGRPPMQIFGESAERERNRLQVERADQQGAFPGGMSTTRDGSPARVGPQSRKEK